MLPWIVIKYLCNFGYPCLPSIAAVVARSGKALARSGKAVARSYIKYLCNFGYPCSPYSHKIFMQLRISMFPRSCIKHLCNFGYSCCPSIAAVVARSGKAVARIALKYLCLLCFSKLLISMYSRTVVKCLCNF